jgi:endoglucanase
MLPALVCILIPWPALSPPNDAAASVNARLGRGMNLGNALEAPHEGAWGMRLEESHFETIADAGFQSVRIPVRWSAHAMEQSPYTIDPSFLERVAWAVDEALGRNLAVVLNFHHIEEVYAEPDAQAERFLALWKQVATAFRDRPRDRVVFEILNEPHGSLDAARWNVLLPKAIETIRTLDPERILMVGPAQWNNFRALDDLHLPEDDHRLIVTFHYYDPFHFTHQGANWAGADAERWLGTRWPSDGKEVQLVREHFDEVKSWADAHQRPVHLGEFGTFEKADLDSRVAWTKTISREAEARGFSWSYWEFGAGFGAFDRERSAWRLPLLRVLIPPTLSR